MKTKLILCFLLLMASYLLSYSQVPQGFNYQAIARDGTEPITTSIKVRITIQSESGGGTTYWIEEHASVLPNSSGLFSLIIGNGARQTGSTVSTFSDIDWASGTKYVKTEIKTGTETEYVQMGSSQLWSVPYSMVSGNVNDTLSKLVVTAEQDVDTTVLFQVRNKHGQTVFAVYNAGVRIYVDNGAKGKKGGFAIGGFGNAKADTPGQEYFIVSRDSIRAYIYDDPSVKAAKGGFAIGGFGNAKTFKNDYLLISPDSARINVSKLESSKGKKGGFAIGGFDPAKGSGLIQDYFRVSPDSIRAYIDTTNLGKAAKGGFAIGGFNNAKGKRDKYLSVYANTTNITVNDSTTGFSITNSQGGASANFMKMNKINYFLGHESGLKTVIAGDNGKFNSFLGYQAGHENIAGSRNVFIGYQTGYKNNAAGNVFIGNKAGYQNVEGANNVFVGFQSGMANSTGQYNTYLGCYAGSSTSTGTNNVYLGYLTGGINEGGENNIVIGSGAGINAESGDNNVYLGTMTGYMNMAGSNNVFLGYKAGYRDQGSNKLYISITDGASLADGKLKALIYGEFDNKFVSINDVLKLTPRSEPPTDPVPTEGTLYVNSALHHIYCYLNGSWKQLDN